MRIPLRQKNERTKEGKKGRRKREKEKMASLQKALPLSTYTYSSRIADRPCIREIIKSSRIESRETDITLANITTQHIVNIPKSTDMPLPPHPHNIKMKTVDYFERHQREYVFIFSTIISTTRSKSSYTFSNNFALGSEMVSHSGRP